MNPAGMNEVALTTTPGIKGLPRIDLAATFRRVAATNSDILKLGLSEHPTDG
jgi:hypothetical protein